MTISDCYRPGPGEQGINSLAQWMAAAEDRRASTVASTVASSTQEATSVDSPLASQDGNNLSGIHHLPSDSSVHAMPESAPVSPSCLDRSLLLQVAAVVTMK